MFEHRDYRRQSEIVIKLYPNKLEMVNAGGLPQGVTVDNLLKVPSTPRNRLLADVLSKTGIVERSGQGIDKIFLFTLSEGKPAPDYTKTDDFDVTAILYSFVKDSGFALFVKTLQDELPDDKKLSVFDMIELCKVRDGEKKIENKSIAHSLQDRGFVEKHGKTNAQFYTLSRRYYEITGKVADYSMLTDWDANQLLAVISPYLQKNGKAKKADIAKIVGDHISDKQLRSFLDQLRKIGIIKTKGERRNMVYMLGDNYVNNSNLLAKAISIGLKALKDKGELK